MVMVMVVVMVMGSVNERGGGAGCDGEGINRKTRKGEEQEVSSTWIGKVVLSLLMQREIDATGSL